MRGALEFGREGELDTERRPPLEVEQARVRQSVVGEQRRARRVVEGAEQPTAGT